jgi:hypothetical protein
MNSDTMSGWMTRRCRTNQEWRDKRDERDSRDVQPR